MVTILALFLSVIIEMIFTEFSPPKSTNWSVFYFVGYFLALGIIATDQFIKSYDKLTRNLSLLIIVFLIVNSIRFLLLINGMYSVYLESVNDYFIDTVRYVFISAALILISINLYSKWLKHSRKY